MSDFRQRCVEIAKRFLQTVVVVDDEAQIDTSPQPHGHIRTPGRDTSPPTGSSRAETAQNRDHSLDAQIIVDSFAEHGMICSVIVPRPNTEPSTLTMKRADMVVLDWQLNNDNGEKALSTLKEILKDTDEQLRLIAVYTGEEDISRIGQTVKDEMQGFGYAFDSENGDNVVLFHQHCRIVIYAKSNTPLRQEIQNRAIAESDIAERLIDDFADMTEGLLPNIALMSLAAVRENAHKVLDKFHAGLDPAFLAHRACLDSPADSQQHMVSLLASELHAIMDDAVETNNPADIGSIADWLASAPNGRDRNYSFGSDKTLSFNEVLTVLREGLEHESSALKKSHFRFLSSGFSRTAIADEELDRRLAWMMNFRTVFGAPLPKLHLGTVLRRHDETGNAKFFLCVRPRCDSVRLREREKVSFLFLPLLFEEKDIIQLVLRTDENTHKRFGVGTKSSYASQWLLATFKPEDGEGAVIAKQDQTSKRFFFTDEDGKEFDWLGELKAEFAQRIAQHFTSVLSRVAVNNSEWLRRSEGRLDA